MGLDTFLSPLWDRKPQLLAEGAVSDKRTEGDIAEAPEAQVCFIA
jgi:hypothetical protein